MKRYLKLCIGLAVFGAAFMSCVKSEDVYDPDSKAKYAYDKYEKSFENRFGHVNSSVDWGFNNASTKAATRGEASGYTISSDYARNYTKNFVMEVLGNLPDGSAVEESETVTQNFEFQSKDGFKFFIFYSNTSEDFEIGYYYYNADEGVDERQEVKVVDQFSTDQNTNVVYFSYQMVTEKTQNPSSDTGAAWWNDGTAEKVQCKQITVSTDNVPAGSVFGFYISAGGKKAYSNKYLNTDNKGFFALINTSDDDSNIKNSYVIGMEDQVSGTSVTDCNNVIFSIPKSSNISVSTPDATVTWHRIIAEDLNDNENSDWDFNDIVIDMALTKNSSGQDVLKCILQAAGAEYKIRIDENDAYEVHKLFGVSAGTMVNTNAKGGITKDPAEFEIEKSFSSVKNVKIEVYKDDTWMELVAPTGKAACKVCVDSDFKWCDEGVNIESLYPDFPSYVQNNYPLDWWN